MKFLISICLSLFAFTPLFAQVDSSLRGSFLGLAYGDALGAITETWTREQIEKAFPGLRSIPQEIPFRQIFQAVGEKQYLRVRPFGYTTDDTQQAALLALVALRNPKWSSPATSLWASSLVEGLRKGSYRGHGKMFSSAVEKLSSGEDYRKSGAKSAGIGAAMRTGVLGAIYRDDLNSLRQATIESTLVTHADVRAVALAYAVSWTVFSFINGRTAEEIRRGLSREINMIETMTLKLKDEGWSMETENAHMISEAFEHLSLVMSHVSLISLQEISYHVTQYASTKMKSTAAPHPNDPFALLGGIHALGLALMERSDPRATLSYIVGLGSDTDTVAAMAGTILGARHGDDWIPTGEMREAARWGKIAHALVSRDFNSTETISDFLDRERTLLDAEKEFQRDCGNLLPSLK